MSKDEKWKNLLSFLPPHMLDLYYNAMISEQDYYFMDIDSLMYNNIQISSNHNVI